MKKLTNILLITLWVIALICFFRGYGIDLLSYIIGALCNAVLILILITWEH